MKAGFTDARVWSLITAYVTVFIFCSGVGIYGNIEFVMREQGYFPDKNEEEKEYIYSTLFTVILLTVYGSKMLIGILVDQYGLWAVELFSYTLGGTGLLCIALSTPANSWLALVGYPLFMTNIGCWWSFILIANSYYPENSSMLQGLGFAIQTANAALYIFYKKMTHTSWFWYLLLFFVPLFVLRTFTLMPRYLRNPGTEPYIGWKHRHVPRIKKELRSATILTMVSMTETTCWKSFKEYAKIAFSYKILPLYLWFTTVDIRYQCFNAELQPWLRWATEESYGNSTAEQDARTDAILFYTDIYNYFLILGLVVSLVAGAVVNVAINKVRDKCSFHQNTASIRVQVFVMIYISLSGIAMSAFASIKSVGWMTYGAMFFQTLVKSSVFVTRNLYMYALVPASFQGRILATTSLLQMTTAAVQPVLTTIAVEVFGGDYGALSLLLAGVIGVGMIGPVVAGYLFLWRGTSAYEEQSYEHMDSNGSENPKSDKDS